MRGLRMVGFLAFAIVLCGAGAWAGEIHRAVEAGDQALVTRLLTGDPRLVNAPDDDRDRSLPLHVAASTGRLEIARLLLERGAALEGGDKDESTPLGLACMRRQAAMVDFLLERGADVNRRDRNGNYALSFALSGGDAAIVRRVVAAGADFNFAGPGGETLMHRIAQRGLTEHLPMLLERGADPNAIDRGRRTPLHHAARNGRPEVIAALLAAGANPSLQDEGGATPLAMAVRAGSLEIVDALLRAQADADIAESKLGRTPLHTAAALGYGDIAARLLEAGADQAARDGAGDTPVALATRHGHGSIVTSLAARGARPAATADPMARLGLDTPLSAGEALVYYLNHSGFAVRTRSRLLIFDSYHRGRSPDEPGLRDGYVDPRELAGSAALAFVSHDHADHCDTTIFAWKDTAPKITYVLGCDVPRAPAHVRMEPRQERTIDGVKVRTIESNDSGVGYLVEVDGVRIFHAGDHANRSRDFSTPYKAEIDALADAGRPLDIAFLPVSGCGFGDQVAVRMGVEYALERLRPRVFFPMHAGGGGEWRNVELVRELGPKFPGTAMAAPLDGGDRYLLRQGTLVAGAGVAGGTATLAGADAGCPAPAAAASCSGR